MTAMYLVRKYSFFIPSLSSTGSRTPAVRQLRRSDASMPLAGSPAVVQDAASTYIWYASYASNMCTARFMCYIQGGQAEGMANACCGGRDKTPPLASRWMQVPHKLIFGRDWSYTWASGGVAFLDPVPHDGSPTTVILLYKITLQQLCDVLAQENGMDPSDSKIVVEPRHISTLRNNWIGPTHGTFDFLPATWYGTIKYLGDEDGLPILTITCSIADMKRYKERQLPVRAPSETYTQVIIKGLLEYGFSEEEARAYVSSHSPPDGP